MAEQENIYEKIKLDFHYRYQKYVVSLIEGYEKTRKIALVIAILLMIIITIIFVLLFVCHIISDSDIDNINKSSGTILIIVYLCLINSCVYGLIKKRFEVKIKKKIMPCICNCFSDLKWIEPDLSLKFIRRIIAIFGNSFDFSRGEEETLKYKLSNLIPDFVRVDFDDCFVGSHNNISYKIDELTAFDEDSSSDDGKKNIVTVFKGVIISLDMNKNFSGNTVIRPNSIAHISPSKNLRHTVLEDVEFEKKFDVFTDDEVEARYLITPSFMERLSSMQVAFRADKISAAFYQNTLYIALHTNKDLFSVGSLVKPVCDEKQFFTMFEEILSIIKLIDYFKLNEKTGL